MDEQANFNAQAPIEMKEVLAVTVAGNRFTLTERQASILSGRLRAALQVSHAPVTFTHQVGEADTSIMVEWMAPSRAAPTRTDC